MTATIHPVVEDDVRRIHDINQANVPDVGSVDRASLERLVELAALALVVRVGSAETDETAGFCIVLPPGTDYRSVNYRWFMDRYDDAMYLDRVAFDTRFQGRGLGSQLYAEVDHRLAADHPDVARLTLEVNVDPPNEQSMAFHRRLGFREVGRQVTDYGFEVAMLERPIGPA